MEPKPKEAPTKTSSLEVAKDALKVAVDVSLSLVVLPILITYPSSSSILVGEGLKGLPDHNLPLEGVLGGTIP